MPIVWKKHPNATVCLAGADPSAQVIGLKSERVSIIGWVDDISRIYRQSRVFVAPMLVNTGLQNKLLEAMASEIPCITTSLANNALKAKPNNEVIIADDKEQFSDSISRILEQDQALASIATNGKNYVKANFSWEKSSQEFIDAFNKINRATSY